MFSCLRTKLLAYCSLVDILDINGGKMLIVFFFMFYIQNQFHKTLNFFLPWTCWFSCVGQQRTDAFRYISTSFYSDRVQTHKYAREMMQLTPKSLWLIYVFKSRGEPFLWNRIWDLAGFGRLAVLKVLDWAIKLCYFCVLMGKKYYHLFKEKLHNIKVRKPCLKI